MQCAFRSRSTRRGEPQVGGERRRARRQETDRGASGLGYRDSPTGGGAGGLIPEEIVRKFGHLSLAQVHAALAYYHANQAEIDADLECEARETEALEAQYRR